MDADYPRKWVNIARRFTVILTPQVCIQVLRKIKKYRLFNDFPGIHIIIPMGEFWQLYTAPRGNDFAYTPLLKTEANTFLRAGNVDSWHAIALVLDEELKTIKDNSFKGQVERIISTFNGGKGPLTAGESHAVGAIICDYAAGVRGSLHYLETLAQKVGLGDIIGHMTAWAGDRPGYGPAIVGGRSLLAGEDFSHSWHPEAPRMDQATVSGRRYTVNVEGIRSTGECFWDTLRHYGINHANIAAAATAAHLTVDQPVMVDQIEAFFAALAPLTGTTYRINLDIINLLNLQPLSTKFIGNGDIEINIGYFVNPRDHQGHYVPNV